MHRPGFRSGLGIVLLTFGVVGARAEEPYRALGTQPNWSATIANGEVTYESAAGARLVARVTLQRNSELERTIRSSGIELDILTGYHCTLGTSGRRYADSVVVTVRGHEYLGCGGAILAADDLDQTSWHFTEIGGDPVPLTGDLLRDDVYAIDFSTQRFVGYDGCNRISGGIRREGDILTIVPPIMRTDGACSAPVMNRERRLFEIMRTPMRLTFPDGDTLVMTNATGRIRLRRTGDVR
jgi:heat shock protein HslJ/uncharacterized membrane protein